MKRRIVEIKMIFLVLVFGFMGCTEHQKAEHRGREIDPHELDFQKDTLYFLWENYQEYNEYTNKIETITPCRSDTQQALTFAYPKGGYFLFKDGFISEKLKIKNLKNYKITRFRNPDSIHQSWHEKNKEVIKNKYRHWLRTPPIINKEFAYVVYIVVISEDKKYFTIYPVIWDNQYESE